MHSSAPLGKRSLKNVYVSVRMEAQSSVSPCVLISFLLLLHSQCVGKRKKEIWPWLDGPSIFCTSEWMLESTNVPSLPREYVLSPLSPAFHDTLIVLLYKNVDQKDILIRVHMKQEYVYPC